MWITLLVLGNIKGENMFFLDDLVTSFLGDFTKSNLQYIDLQAVYPLGVAVDVEKYYSLSYEEIENEGEKDEWF